MQFCLKSYTVDSMLTCDRNAMTKKNWAVLVFFSLDLTQSTNYNVFEVNIVSMLLGFSSVSLYQQKKAIGK